MLHIIMGAYNGEKYIKEQMDSILNNTYTEWKLFICDDGSTDSTREIALEYEKNYPDKIVYSLNDGNQGVIKNFLSNAKKYPQDYIMFCDQDDVWLPEKIAHTLSCIKKMEKKYGIDTPLCVFTDAKVVDESLEVIESSFFSSNHLDVKKVDLPHLLMENKLLGCTVLFNQSLLMKMNQLPENAKMHDWWIGLIGASFGKVGYLKEATMLYRQHGNNVVGNQSFMGYVKRRLKSITNQKKALQANEEQAKEFLEHFGAQLTEEKTDILYNFANLSDDNWYARRKKILSYGFLKTGVIRNIGVLLLI